MRNFFILILFVFFKAAPAQIYYTDVVPDFSVGGSAVLDINNDGVVDYGLDEAWNTGTGWYSASTSITCYPNSKVLASSACSVLSLDTVDLVCDTVSGFTFKNCSSSTLLYWWAQVNNGGGGGYSGPWLSNNSHGYVSISFSAGTNVYYGWIHLRIVPANGGPGPLDIIVEEYAYSSNCIHAGEGAPYSDSWSTLYVNDCNPVVSPSGNHIWSLSGTYMDTIPNSAGNDSIITVNLVSNTQSTTSINCCNSSYFWNGTLYSASGSYSDTIPNSAGCDSIMFLNLNLNYSTIIADTIFTTKCESFTFNNIVYTASGIYTDTLQTIGSCDSIVTLNLTINSEYSKIDTITECAYFYNWQGTTYTSSGTFTTNVPTSSGCDSLLTLNLTLNHNSYSTFNVSECGVSYNWQNSTYTNSGSYNHILTNMAGCDSIMTLNLMFLNVDTSVSSGTNSLTANATNANFQWLDCNNSLQPIPGATFAIAPADTSDHSLAVAVTQNGCTDTSSCHEVIYIGMKEWDANLEFQIFPNPSFGKFVVVLENKNFENRSITVFNTLGELIFNRSIDGASIELDLSQNPAGVYSIQVTGPKGITSKRLILGH
jgi:hypothetical protein